MRNAFSLVTLVFLLANQADELQAQNLLTNGGLELELGEFGGRDSFPPGWTTSEGPPVSANDPNNPEHLLSLTEPADFSHLLLEGGWNMWFQPYNGTFAEAEDNFAHLMQTVPGSPGMEYTMKGSALFENFFPGGVNNLNLVSGETPTGAPFDDGPPSPTDAYFALEFLDAANTVLPGSVEIELKANGQPSNTTWHEHTLVGVAPSGTTQVRVRASMIDGVLNPLPNPQSFQMSFFVDAFSLTAAAPSLTADFDADGDVDGNDYLAWQRGMGTASGATKAQGDADGNGAVNAADLSAWTSQFGSTIATSASAAVPEPGSACLAGLGAALGGGVVRRKALNSFGRT